METFGGSGDFSREQGRQRGIVESIRALQNAGNTAGVATLQDLLWWAQSDSGYGALV